MTHGALDVSSSGVLQNLSTLNWHRKLGIHLSDNPPARSFDGSLQCPIHFGVHKNIAEAFAQNLTNIYIILGMKPKTELRRQSAAEW